MTNRCLTEVFYSKKEHSMNRKTRFEIVDMESTVTQQKNQKTSKSSLAKELSNALKKTRKQVVFNGNIVNSKSGKPISYIEVVASNILYITDLYTTAADKDGNFTNEIKGYKFGDKLYLDLLLKKKYYGSETSNYRRKISSIKDPINLDKLFL